MKNKVKACI